jgi:hypothetical protein
VNVAGVGGLDGPSGQQDSHCVSNGHDPSTPMRSHESTQLGITPTNIADGPSSSIHEQRPSPGQPEIHSPS